MQLNKKNDPLARLINQQQYAQQQNYHQRLAKQNRFINQIKNIKILPRIISISLQPYRERLPTQTQENGRANLVL